jgi:hypothetical protein
VKEIEKGETEGKRKKDRQTDINRKRRGREIKRQGTSGKIESLRNIKSEKDRQSEKEGGKCIKH